MVFQPFIYILDMMITVGVISSLLMGILEILEDLRMKPRKKRGEKSNIGWWREVV